MMVGLKPHLQAVLLSRCQKTALYRYAHPDAYPGQAIPLPANISRKPP